MQRGMEMIIAEIGINHNGDLQLAKDMILMAKDAGADVVKFQKRNPDKCVPEHQKNVLKETPWGTMTYIKYKRKIEFNRADYQEIDRYCKEIGILWTASIWDIDSLIFMTEFEVPFIKIPSALMTDLVFVHAAYQKFDKVVISTGMSTQTEIDELIRLIPTNKETVLMHCTSTYPTKPQHEHLSYIGKLRHLSDLEVGYSGHELGIDATLVAYTLDCKWIERHFTISNDLWGTDQKSSLEPEEFKNMVSKFKKIDLMLGTQDKVLSTDELNMRNKLRK